MLTWFATLVIHWVFTVTIRHFTLSSGLHNQQSPLHSAGSPGISETLFLKQVRNQDTELPTIAPDIACGHATVLKFTATAQLQPGELECKGNNSFPLTRIPAFSVKETHVISVEGTHIQEKHLSNSELRPAKVEIKCFSYLQCSRLVKTVI